MCDMNCSDEALESPFLTPSSHETGWIVWSNGEAAGFYTVKQQGIFLYKNHISVYSHLDLMYPIRKIVYPEIFWYKPWRPKDFSNLKSMFLLALYNSFEYLCYGSAAITV